MVMIIVIPLNAKRQSVFRATTGRPSRRPWSEQEDTLFITVGQLQSGFPTADSPGGLFACTALKPGFAPTSLTGSDWYWPAQSPGPVTHCWDSPLLAPPQNTVSH